MLPERHPQDAIEEILDDVVVVASAAASVVFPNPPAPLSALVIATGSLWSPRSRRLFNSPNSFGRSTKCGGRSGAMNGHTPCCSLCEDAERLAWPETELKRYLRAGKRSLSVHDWAKEKG